MSISSSTRFSKAEHIWTPPPESELWIEASRAPLEELWGPKVDLPETGGTVKPFETFVATLSHRERVLLFCTTWEFNSNGEINHDGGLHQYVFSDVTTFVERISRRRVISQYNNITGETLDKDEGVPMLRDILGKSLCYIQPPPKSFQFWTIAINRVWKGFAEWEKRMRKDFSEGLDDEQTVAALRYAEGLDFEHMDVSIALLS
ncbi:hypothetical protein F5882DRAFT_460201 [Hyaloscypha sp. PMI_1271]|nr:hypothetical protein F5882DRAFT_460201 [Hyaloscypha sp. PMI_1271]